ncbi:hypothetical protein ACFQX8_01065 [Klenkia terrae]|uniref:hypothetical protein n=1 Tax=Klenkia terrae TaxID=1052259 RepID=UPI00361AAAD1
MSLANLLIGNGLIVYLSLLAGFKRRTYGLVAYALLSPSTGCCTRSPPTRRPGSWSPSPSTGRRPSTG